RQKGLILGAYEGCSPGEYKLTPAGEKFDCQLGGKLNELIQGSNLRKGKALVFSNLSHDFQAIAVANLGPEDAGYSEFENLNLAKENVRIAAGAGASMLQGIGINNMFVEEFTDSEAAAEGTSLAVWKYDELKSKHGKSAPPKLELFDEGDKESWQRGLLKADAQNMARKLEEMPANLLTPSMFAQETVETLCACQVQVEVRDRTWMEIQKLNSLLAMAGGSCEHPLFIELSYCGGNVDDKPVVIVGKGVTFDSGGTNLKPCKGMSEFRGDMAGAAVVVGTFKAVACLSLPINIVGLIPMCENMPGGSALKPGDVVTALNGKKIRLENTSNQGWVVLADALSYSSQYNPSLVINVATMTMSMRRVLGAWASGAFSNSEVIWREMSRAGAETGDRLWNFPLWKQYTFELTGNEGVDVSTAGKEVGGTSCLGAAFIKEFVPPNVDFIHLDITGTGMEAPGTQFSYLRKGTMTGRPTRTLVQFLYQSVCPHEKIEE
ncbi:hypothetical protein AAG570_003220, partial [Ranatra chinensis]